jgi:hypothetical protein
MNTFLITYDLVGNEPATKYAKLIERAKELSSNWWKCLESVIIIKTSYAHDQVRDDLLRLLDSNDKLLVITVSTPAAWTLSFPQDCTDWLMKNL